MSRASKARRKAKRAVMRAAVMHNCKIDTQLGNASAKTTTETAYLLGTGWQDGDTVPAWIETDLVVGTVHDSSGIHVDKHALRPGAYLKAFNAGRKARLKRQEQEQEDTLRKLLVQKCHELAWPVTPDNLAILRQAALENGGAY